MEQLRCGHCFNSGWVICRFCGESVCQRHSVPTDDAEAHLCDMCARPTEVDLATICDIDVQIPSKVEGVDWDNWVF